MSLLGRLEDLSLPDIIQIVFLSRRTGVLEIVDGDGRSTILFHNGLIIDASSPEEPELGSILRERANVDWKSHAEVERMIEEGAPLGTALLELGVIQQDELARLVRERITRIVTPLLASREGEFNFILSDSASQFELEYDPDSVFREGGVSPQQVLGAPEGEKLKPLSGLEETMRAGKALLGAHRRAPAAPSSRLEIPLRPLPERTEIDALEDLVPREPEPETETEVEDESVAGSDAIFDAGMTEEDRRAAFDALQLWADESELPQPPPPARTFGQREVEVPTTDPMDAFFAPPDETPPFEAAIAAEAPETAGDVFPGEDVIRDEDLRGEDLLPAEGLLPENGRVAEEHLVPEEAFLPAPTVPEALALETLAETVVLYEPDPLLRVAARRAFTKKGFEFLQFGNLGDTREAAEDLLERDRFFVTFLDLVGTAAGSDSPELLLETIKRKNAMLPVVVIDREADLRRRHELLALGADFYLTKPSPAHLQPGFAEETLGLFADELMMFAERAFGPRRPRGAGGPPAAAAREIAALSGRERSERGFALLRRLISELTDPDDLDQLAETILRMAEGYVERGVLFTVTPSEAVALAGFGETGGGEAMDRRVRRITIPRSEPSVLGEVIDSKAPHRGKLRRSPANEELLRALGRILPTEVTVLPIAHRGAVVGLLYGDNARTRRPLQDLTGLEIFLSQAGLALENALSANGRSQRTS